MLYICTRPVLRLDVHGFAVALFKGKSDGGHGIAALFRRSSSRDIGDTACAVCSLRNGKVKHSRIFRTAVCHACLAACRTRSDLSDGNRRRLSVRAGLSRGYAEIEHRSTRRAAVVDSRLTARGEGRGLAHLYGRSFALRTFDVHGLGVFKTAVVSPRKIAVGVHRGRERRSVCAIVARRSLRDTEIEHRRFRRSAVRHGSLFARFQSRDGADLHGCRSTGSALFALWRNDCILRPVRQRHSIGIAFVRRLGKSYALYTDALVALYALRTGKVSHELKSGFPADRADVHFRVVFVIDIARLDEHEPPVGDIFRVRVHRRDAGVGLVNRERFALFALCALGSYRSGECSRSAVGECDGVDETPVGCRRGVGYTLNAVARCTSRAARNAELENRVSRIARVFNGCIAPLGQRFHVTDGDSCRTSRRPFVRPLVLPCRSGGRHGNAGVVLKRVRVDVHIAHHRRRAELKVCARLLARARNRRSEVYDAAVLPCRHGDDTPAPRLGEVFQGDGAILVLHELVRGHDLRAAVRDLEVRNVLVVCAPGLRRGNGERVCSVRLLRPLLIREHRRGEEVYPLGCVTRGQGHIRLGAVVVELRSRRGCHVNGKVRHERVFGLLFDIIDAAFQHGYLRFRRVKARRKARARSVGQFVVNLIDCANDGFLGCFKRIIRLVLFVRLQIGYVALRLFDILFGVSHPFLQVVNLALCGRHPLPQRSDVPLRGGHPVLKLRYIARNRALIRLKQFHELLEVCFRRVIGNGVNRQCCVLHRECCRERSPLRRVRAPADIRRRSRKHRHLDFALHCRDARRYAGRGVIKVLEDLRFAVVPPQRVRFEGRHRRVVRVNAVGQRERHGKRNARKRIDDPQLREVVRALKDAPAVQTGHRAVTVQKKKHICASL